MKQLLKLKEASKLLGNALTSQRNAVLNQLASLIRENKTTLLAANEKDLARARKIPKVTKAFLDRLTLNDARIDGLLSVLREVQNAQDPVGRVLHSKTLENGLRAQYVAGPLGVIFLIYESRPNVAVESFALAIKSGNALILKGGRESAETVDVLYHLMGQALQSAGLPATALWGLESTDRKSVAALLKMKNQIDVVIPRGGDSLIRFVTTHTQIPVIKNDRGMCHVYIDRAADLDMGVRIVDNSKTQRPGVCNAMETLLVHESVARAFLEKLIAFWNAKEQELQIRACPQSLSILKKIKSQTVKTRAAVKRDWDTEYLDFILNCAVVSDADKAIAHIERHGSRHSEAIVTNDKALAEKFLSTVDAAATYWNASTRFTDGHELGLGGEIGISTQKLHVRGPVGLEGLTSARWIMRGNGQVRK